MSAWPFLALIFYATDCAHICQKSQRCDDQIDENYCCLVHATQITQSSTELNFNNDERLSVSFFSFLL